MTMTAQNAKVIAKVRKGHLRETEAHRKNALRSNPERLAAAVQTNIARSNRATSMPTGQITAEAAKKIDARTRVATQLDLFGG